MCTAVDSIHDIASGQYTCPEKDSSFEPDGETLFQLLTRVKNCLNENPKGISDKAIQNELETKVSFAPCVRKSSINYRIF